MYGYLDGVLMQPASALAILPQQPFLAVLPFPVLPSEPVGRSVLDRLKTRFQIPRIEGPGGDPSEGEHERALPDDGSQFSHGVEQMIVSVTPLRLNALRLQDRRQAGDAALVRLGDGSNRYYDL